ncbi:MAG TPA: hypothetical protein VLA25_04875, partial [Methylotenera sp.]|nr:hypothetical protein [Methylotenera sp.]
MSDKRQRYRSRVRLSRTAVELKEKAFYLDLVGDFKPLIPPPVIKIHEGVEVVRDDLIGLGGAKARFAELLVAKTEQDTLVYASLGYSYICLALIKLSKMYNKKLILIMPTLPAKNHEISPAHEYCVYSQEVNTNLFCYQIRAKNFGTLTAFAKNVAHELHAALIPTGLKHDAVMAMIVKTATTIPQPNRFCVAVGTTMLINGLQIAWPDAQARGVAVRNLYGPVGYAEMIGHYLWRNRPAHIIPPFPSTSKVDAKVWE